MGFTGNIDFAYPIKKKVGSTDYPVHQKFPGGVSWPLYQKDQKTVMPYIDSTVVYTNNGSVEFNLSKWYIPSKIYVNGVLQYTGMGASVAIACNRGDLIHHETTAIDGFNSWLGPTVNLPYIIEGTVDITDASPIEYFVGHYMFNRFFYEMESGSGIRKIANALFDTSTISLDNLTDIFSYTFAKSDEYFSQVSDAFNFNLGSTTILGDRAFDHTFAETTDITVTISFPGVISCGTYALTYMFYNSSFIDLDINGSIFPDLVSVNNRFLDHMFYMASYIDIPDYMFAFDNLVSSLHYTAALMFSETTDIGIGKKLLSFPKLEVLGNNAFEKCFASVYFDLELSNFSASMAPLLFPSIDTIGNLCFNNMFFEATSILKIHPLSLDMSNATSIGSDYCNAVCQDATGLTDISTSNFSISNIDNVGGTVFRNAFRGSEISQIICYTGITPQSMPLLAGTNRTAGYLDYTTLFYNSLMPKYDPNESNTIEGYLYNAGRISWYYCENGSLRAYSGYGFGYPITIQ